MTLAHRALVLAYLLVLESCQSYPGLQSPSVSDTSMSGMNDMLTTFFNSSIVDENMNSLAANLAGVSHSLLSTPLLGYLPAALQTVNSTLHEAVQDVSSYVSKAAEQELANQIKLTDKTLHSAANNIANGLPKNNSILYVPKASGREEMKLGDEKSGWAGFEIPKIDLGDGVIINPATVDLSTLEQLVDDIESQFCSPTFTNTSGTVPATLTYPTFTLTLETGACALTKDFTPNPDNPYDDWLNTKGFVCKTPELSFDQEPSSYVAEYTAPATLITSSCKIAKNTTDGWTKTLYSAGDPVTYASWDAFMVATMNGSQAPVFSASNMKDAMAKIAADVHSYIAAAAAKAPPLVIHVKEDLGENASHAWSYRVSAPLYALGKDLLPKKSGRRLKELIQRLE